MADQVEGARSEGTGKKRWVRPSLVEYGTIAKLTEGATRPFSDSPLPAGRRPTPCL